MRKTLAAALCAAALSSFASPAAASLVTWEFDLIDNGGGDAGSLVFSYDDAAPLVAPISSSLGIGTVFFRIEALTFNLRLDQDDIGVRFDGSPGPRLGAAFPPRPDGTPSFPSDLTLTLDDIREDGLAIILNTRLGFAFIEASPATPLGFADIANFSWTLVAPGLGDIITLNAGAAPTVGLSIPGGGFFDFATGNRVIPGDPPVAVPAPASGLLMLAGLGLLGLMRGRARAG